MSINPSDFSEDEGAILLLDDYVGSMSTIKEAAKTLRKKGGFKGNIVPLTMARIRRKLGSVGMI